MVLAQTVAVFAGLFYMGYAFYCAIRAVGHASGSAGETVVGGVVDLGKKGLAFWSKERRLGRQAGEIARKMEKSYVELETDLRNVLQIIYDASGNGTLPSVMEQVKRALEQMWPLSLRVDEGVYKFDAVVADFQRWHGGELASLRELVSKDGRIAQLVAAIDANKLLDTKKKGKLLARIEEYRKALATDVRDANALSGQLEEIAREKEKVDSQQGILKEKIGEMGTQLESNIRAVYGAGREALSALSIIIRSIAKIKDTVTKMQALILQERKDFRAFEKDAEALGVEVKAVTGVGSI